MKERRVAKALGWFSIGLGLAGLLAPRKTARTIGLRHHHGLLQSVGVREIASGVGLLSGRRRSEWLWSRVAGDLMDLALLGGALSSRRNDRGRVVAATLAVAGVTVVDLLCSQGAGDGEMGRDEGRPRRGRKIQKSITINRPPEELYNFWRNFENLPRFMTHLKSVTTTGDKQSHWVAKGPMGTEVKWDAQIIDERPHELIAWRSLEGAEVENTGTVRFERAPGGRGTIVRVKIRYRPPGGAVGATIAKLLGQAPEKQIPVDLLRFRQLMETGEIARTEGQPAGRARSTSRKFDDLLRR